MFDNKPTLAGERVTLRPVGLEHVAGLEKLLTDPEVTRLTGSHASFEPGVAEKWYATRGDHANRLDLAILADGEYVGEVVLNELDIDNLSCNLRIALISDQASKGYGTEAIRLVVDHAFRTTPLHRISLGVYSFNPRAIHVYEKVGFIKEGVLRDALLWEGQWADEIVMAVLRTDWALA
ncbi:GNAT family N-acetyltransferase [Nonomuraea sp. NPDC050536]|uniref:GNAT family N-acetyltransferase n=1 Tax=Nonomuraea sp. NPDC050536 TaxID=3364366 RepID=UPI0037C58232